MHCGSFVQVGRYAIIHTFSKLYSHVAVYPHIVWRCIHIRRLRFDRYSACEGLEVSYSDLIAGPTEGGSLYWFNRSNILKKFLEL